MNYKNLGTPHKTDSLALYNCDCMELLKQTPDNYYDICVVDPPYGININKQSGFGSLTKDKHKNWDRETPNEIYFKELFRVSNHQIIWGANYFFDFLSNTKSLLSWDKMNGTNDMSDFELAWSSFDKPARRFSMHHFSAGYDKKIHPTQKPVKLYDWIFANYAEKGMKVLDTHLGSMSSAISAHYAGIHLTGSELDKDYFKAGCERVERETSQTTLSLEANATDAKRARGNEEL